MVKVSDVFGERGGIVSDDDVATALEYLAIDPHPLALSRKDLTDAENEQERIWAERYLLETDGTVRDREAATERSADVVASKREVALAQLAYERHRARIRAAEMLIEVWRSENANARASERVR